MDYIVNIAKPLFTEPEITLAEIGIGLGTLTYPILSLQKETDLFEIDFAYIQLAKEEILPKFPNAHLYAGDALENLFHIFPKRVFVFGNLPYHLTTEIISTLLIHCRMFQGGIFMVQKEFAERLVKETSSLSVFLSAFCDLKYLKTVHKNCFFPIPKIHSALILLTPKSEKARTIGPRNLRKKWQSGLGCYEPFFGGNESKSKSVYENLRFLMTRNFGRHWRKRSPCLPYLQPNDQKN